MSRWLTEERVCALRAQGRLREVTRIGPPTPDEKAQQAREWNGNVALVGLNKIDREHAKTSKFRNVKTDGYASKKEAARASVLKLMQEAGQIRALREQPEYELIPRQEGERACFYRADFAYEEFCADGWRAVVEDTKGVKTPDYIIKRKLMLHVHRIRVRES